MLGLEVLTGGRPAYVNFTGPTLVEGYAACLPRERLVVEVLEDVAPDPDVLAACRDLKAAGYLIALDDVVSVDLPGVLVDLADIVKVDFQRTDRAARRRIACTFRARHLLLLAEKVETERDVEDALADGFDLFQGFFFARPALVSGREVPALKQNLLRLLGEAFRPDPDHRRIEDIIRHDVALAFKLLVHLRGVAWGQWRPIDSVRRALLLLGDTGLRRWASIVAVASLGHDRPPELVVTSLVRAAFCEGMLTELGRPELADDGFLVGLFSTIDAFLGQPLAEALDRLAVDDAVRAAILGEEGALRPVLDLALAYERGHWPLLARLAAALGATDDALESRYRAAVAFGTAVAQAEPVPAGA